MLQAKEQAEEQAEGEEEEVSAPYEEESPSQELPLRWVGGELVRRVVRTLAFEKAHFASSLFRPVL